MRIIFSGTPKFSLPALNALLASQHEIVAVYTQPDRPAGRGLKLKASPVKELAVAANLPVFQPKSFKDDLVQDELRSFNADVFIDVAYGLLIPKEVLLMPRYGCVNIHPSLLPRWRGAAPIQRAILAGDKETGVTIMQLDEGLDTGPIYKQKVVPINDLDSSGILEDKLAQIGAEMLLDVLDDLENGTAKLIPQASDNSCYAAKISKEEAKIDWSKSAIEIDRMVRAFNPWPIAYTETDKQMLRIFKTSVALEPPHVPPGTIISSDKNGINIATGDGVISIIELQLPGSRSMTAQEMLNSKRDLFVAGKKIS